MNARFKSAASANCRRPILLAMLLSRPRAPAPTTGGSRSEHWRYSGSLLPTGFDEIDQQRSMVLVEISDHNPAQIELIPLSPYRQYAIIEGSEPRYCNSSKNYRPQKTIRPPPGCEWWYRIASSARA